jgi:hypothetical protein
MCKHFWNTLPFLHFPLAYFLIFLQGRQNLACWQDEFASTASLYHNCKHTNANVMAYYFKIKAQKV